MSVGRARLTRILLLSFIHELLFIDVLGVLLLLVLLLCFESSRGRLILAISSGSVVDIGLAVDTVEGSTRVASLAIIEVARCKILRVDSTCPVYWVALAHVDSPTVPLPRKSLNLPFDGVVDEV